MDIQPTPPKTPASPLSPRFPLFLALLSLLLLLSTAFLVYQNMQLKKQIAKVQVAPAPYSAVNPVEDITASWNTYTNTRFGFSLKYPQDYMVSNENPNGQSIYFVPIGYDALSEQEKYSSITINVNVISSVAQSPLTAESYISSLKEPGYSNIRDITSVTTQGHHAIRFMSNNTQVGSGNDEIHIIITTNKRNELIFLSMGVQGNADPYFFPSQILSTFKFLSQDVSDSTSQSTYTNPDGLYTFQYPSNWKHINGIPKNFQTTKFYTEGEDIQLWLNGKMFGATCRGPILQNTNNPNELIAFEIVPTDSDGGWCWSTGYFFDDNKWKISELYIYPPGSENKITPEWKGDFFIMKQAGSGSGFMANAVLVNRETYQLLGEDSFKKILTTFKFTQ